jgi:hypothetical protein
MFVALNTVVPAIWNCGPDGKRLKQAPLSRPSAAT